MLVDRELYLKTQPLPTGGLCFLPQKAVSVGSSISEQEGFHCVTFADLHNHCDHVCDRDHRRTVVGLQAWQETWHSGCSMI